MKIWLSQFLGLCSLLFIFSACEKDETQAILVPTASPTLAASTSSLTLRQANESQDAITYTWTPVSFAWTNAANEYSPNVTYTLQVDKQGNNFAAPVSLNAGAGPNTTIKVKDLNENLNNLGLTAGTATPLEVRLRVSLAPNSLLYSDALPLTATSYEVCVPPNADTWALVGPAADGWPGNPDPVTDAVLTYDCGTRTYRITRALNAGEFKFRKNKAWTVNYGDNGADGALELDGANIKVDKAGTYTVILDLNATKFTLTQ